MCGIAGFLSPRVPDSPDQVLHRMNQVMAHRGPDEEGAYLNQGVGLGMRRLSVIDLESGTQPIWNESRSVVIVFNGEIYNFPELKKDLLTKGHKFSTQSDTEVIVHLYEEHGIECLQKLNGMFAFALYDFEKELLFIARDRLGEKPLHYFFENGEFAFSSEIKSLIEYPSVGTEMSMAALDLYLTYEYVPAPYTIFEQIKKLLPGHYMTLSKGQLDIQPYWQAELDEQFTGSFAEGADLLRSHIDRSVKMRTISDVPLGAFLSGGIDSSLITAFLTRHSSQKVKTFSIAFDEATFDESSHAQKVAKFLGTDHHEERLSSRNMLDLLPSILENLDEPFADGSLIPTYFLSQHTRKTVKVALSGDAGDEVFGGYPTYQAHKVAHCLPRWLGHAGQRILNHMPSSDEYMSLDFKLRRFAAGLQFNLPERHQVWMGAFEPSQRAALYTQETKERLGRFDAFSILQEQWKTCKSSSYLNRIWNLDMRFYMQDDILVKVDRASMANSLEVRVPFLDHKLVEFANSLPPKYKLCGLRTKHILKNVAKDYLPREIINRPKKGFAMPVGKWLKTDLKDLASDAFSKQTIKSNGLFNAEYIQKIFGDHLSGRANHRKLLWPLFVFQMWHQKYK